MAVDFIYSPSNLCFMTTQPWRFFSIVRMLNDVSILKTISLKFFRVATGKVLILKKNGRKF